MEKALLQDVAEIDKRIEVLRGMASKVEIDTVRRHYNEDELSQIKDFISEESLSLMEKEEAFSEIRTKHQKECKLQKQAISKSLKDMKRGYSESEEEVFLMEDQENKQMHIYDKHGVYLSSRRMLPSEMQTKIIEFEKTGTHNQ